MDQDAVFKALADPSRRTLLDALFQDDGQALGALVRRLALTRFVPASAGMSGVGAGALPAALAMVPRGSYMRGA